MQPLCSSGKKKMVKFGPKVKFTKMKIKKTSCVHFFKYSLTKTDVTPTLELDEGNVSTFATI